MSIYCSHSDGTPLKDFYQWDYDQSIIISGASVSPLPQIHFCDQCAKTAIVVEPTVSGQNLTVDVPNILLRSAGNITIFIYEPVSGESYRTVDAVRIPVNPRPQPDGFVYSDNITYINIAASIEEIKAIRDKVDTATVHQPIISEGYWQIWDANTERYLPTSFKAIGEDGSKWFLGTDVSVSGGDSTIVPGSKPGDFYFNTNTAEMFELMVTMIWISRGVLPSSGDGDQSVSDGFGLPKSWNNLDILANIVITGDTQYVYQSVDWSTYDFIIARTWVNASVGGYYFGVIDGYTYLFENTLSAATAVKGRFFYAKRVADKTFFVQAGVTNDNSKLIKGWDLLTPANNIISLYTIDDTPTGVKIYASGKFKIGDTIKIYGGRNNV